MKGSLSTEELWSALSRMTAFLIFELVLECTLHATRGVR